MPILKYSVIYTKTRSKVVICNAIQKSFKNTLKNNDFKLMNEYYTIE